MNGIIQSFFYLLARLTAWTGGLVVILFGVNKIFKTDFGLWTGPAGSRTFTYAPESWQDLLLWLFLLGGTGLVAYLIEKALKNSGWFKTHPGKAPLVIGGAILALVLVGWKIINYGNSLAAANTGGKFLNAIATKVSDEELALLIKADGDRGQTMSYYAFETALLQDNLRVIPILVQNGYNINAQTRVLYKGSGSGETVLMRAAYGYSFHAVQTFLENGAKTDLKNSENQTVLHYAVSGSSVDRVENINLLLKAGAEPNAQNTGGETALHLLLKNKFLSADEFEMVKLLVISGAKLDVKDDNGNTPRSYAEAVEYQYTIGQPLYYQELNQLFKK